jgi:DNA-binding XRE family transcriptional regulator
MSTRDFGKWLGVSETTVFLWEANRVMPRINSYPKLIEVLGCLPEEISRITMDNEI